MKITVIHIGYSIEKIILEPLTPKIEKQVEALNASDLIDKKYEATEVEVAKSLRDIEVFLGIDCQKLVNPYHYS